jgi:hypothetical protein
MHPADAKQAKPQPFGFPAAGGVAGEGQGLGPHQQVGGQGDDLQPDLLSGEPQTKRGRCSAQGHHSDTKTPLTSNNSQAIPGNLH